MVSHLGPIGPILLDCYFESIETDPIKESFLLLRGSDLVMCGENTSVSDEPVIDYCNNLAYRLATVRSTIKNDSVK